jgi:tRNA pseudouridine38-40 synthase
MKRYFLEVAYDGTAYCGWQLQPGRPTVEAELNQALTNLLKQPIAVIGASRTDSGVHSLGNVAVFSATTKIPAEKLKYALNQRLPEDIRIQSSKEVETDFHPRHCNSRKTYEYRIYCGSVELPTERLYTHFTYRKLKVDKMQQAAKYFVGEHDFKSFCSAGSQVKETVRTIYDLTVIQRESRIIIRVTGSGFLYNMVRIIAGTLMEVGIGARQPEEMEEIIQGLDRGLAGPTAPARGLFLIGIEYEK